MPERPAETVHETVGSSGRRRGIGPLGLDRAKALSLLLIPVYIAVVVALVALGDTVVLPPAVPSLLQVPYLVFMGLIPLYVAYVSLAAYRHAGTASTLLLGAGLLAIGLGVLVTAPLLFTPGSANTAITIFNLCALFGALLELAGAEAALIDSRTRPERRPGMAAVVLGGTAALVGAVTVATLLGLLPVFFVPGEGSTAVRSVVLALAIGSLLLASGLFLVLYGARSRDFFFWYAVGLAMIGLGVFAVALIEVFGGELNLVGRLGQVLGASYLLVAFLVLRRQASARNLSPRQMLASFFTDAGAGYRTLIESAGDAIVVLDPECRVLIWNAAAERTFGYAAGDAVGRTLDGLGITDGRLPSLCAADDGPAPLEFEARRKDGSRFPAELVLSHHIAGDEPMTTCIVRDLSDQKRAEAALRETEAHLARAQDIAHVGSWSWEIGTDTLFWSAETYRILGLRPEELPAPINADFLAFVHPDDRGRVGAAIQNALVDGLYNVEFRFVRTGGDEVYAHSHGIVTYANGVPVRMEGTVQDVTDRRRAEETLRETRDYLDSLIDFANAPIIVWDPAFRITRFNAAFEHLSGYAADEVIGRELAMLFPGGSREESLAKIERSITEQWESVEIPILRPDGEVRIALWNSANIYDTEGTTLLATIAQGQDITERKAAEAALQGYAESLRRSNEDLERFAYVSSHDLQEPLRAIVSFSQLLERRYRGRLDADADDYIAFIVEGGTRMQTLIQDLLAYSRVNTTQQQLHPTDAEDVMAAIERNLDLQLREAGAVLTHDPLPTVMADPLQLEQVLANLVSNAIKFRRPDVPLRIHIGASRVNGFWEFSVKDNGIGIEPEYFDRIFVIFQRLHTKDAYPGTGIGLAIVKRIVDRHGGTVRVESTPGEGTTFSFTLPAA